MYKTCPSQVCWNFNIQARCTAAQHKENMSMQTWSSPPSQMYLLLLLGAAW